MFKKLVVGCVAVAVATTGVFAAMPAQAADLQTSPATRVLPAVGEAPISVERRNFGTSWWEIVDGQLRIGPGQIPSTFDAGHGEALSPFREYLTSITSIVFTDPTHTSLGSSASRMFGWMTEVSDIEGINLVDTSSTTDMSYMFASMQSLTDLDVSGWNTSNVTNMRATFSYLYSLENLNLTGWTTSKVTDMSAMFISLRNVTKLDLPNWDTGNVTNMDGMFNSANSLTSVDVSGWNTSKVTSMNGMFNYAQSLTGLDVRNWQTGKVTDMYGMFSQTVSLRDLDVSTWDTGNVINMGRMFEFAKTITKLNVKDWNTSKVTDTSSMFAHAEKLTELPLADWDVRNVRNMSLMFAGSGPLRSLALDLSHWDTRNATNQAYMLSGMVSLASGLTLGKNTALQDNAFNFTPAPANLYTGLWQSIGQGTAAHPAGDWSGTTAELLALSRTGNAAGTYSWQPRAPLTIPVTPAAPSQNKAVVSIPVVTGVTYKNAETDTELSGQITLADGETVNVVAVPNAGYVFSEGAAASWDFTYKKPEAPVVTDPNPPTTKPEGPEHPEIPAPCSSPRKVAVFADTPLGHKFYKEIDWMECMKYSTGWKQATGKPLYKPQDHLQRQAMAAFIYRMEAPKNYKAPKVSPFADVKPGDPFYKEMAWMFYKGYSTGWAEPSGKPTYRPYEPLSREAMAAFIYRLDASKNAVTKAYKAPTSSPLDDLKPGMKFYKEISWMYDAKLTTGNKTTTGKEYWPKDHLSRQAMAAFIYRFKHAPVAKSGNTSADPQHSVVVKSPSEAKTVKVEAHKGFTVSVSPLGETSLEKPLPLTEASYTQPVEGSVALGTNSELLVTVPDTDTGADIDTVTLSFEVMIHNQVGVQEVITYVLTADS